MHVTLSAPMHAALFTVYCVHFWNRQTCMGGLVTFCWQYFKSGFFPIMLTLQTFITQLQLICVYELYCCNCSLWEEIKAFYHSQGEQQHARCCFFEMCHLVTSVYDIQRTYVDLWASHSADSPQEKAYLLGMCVYIYIGISTVGTNVCPNTYLSNWLNIFLLKFQMNVIMRSPRFACF